MLLCSRATILRLVPDYSIVGRDMQASSLPKLVTFDGEARSGKGTVVGATKDYLRDECGKRVMLIDAGQVFRVLGVAAVRAGVDMDDSEALDKFLGDTDNAIACVQLVKDVYRMSKEDRDALIYSNEAGVNSGKMGARPLSQEFKDDLMRKWLRDAGNDGYEIVLFDGRACEETGKMLEAAGLCEFVLGLYFTCDSVVGARRTLGYAATPYDELDADAKQAVDELVAQIDARNNADRTRVVQPIVPPADVSVSKLPDVAEYTGDGRPMYIVDTSADITKEQMALPVARLVASHV
jgi:cytidylate kinase